MIKLYMGIPSTGTRCDLQGYALREIEKKYAGQIEFIYPKECVHRIFHDSARNGVVKEFLASGADILWFLDSDVAPPIDILDLVVKHGEYWDLAGAPYPVFMTPRGYNSPQVVFCVYESDGIGMQASKIPHSGTAMVSGIATGCMFIKRHVIEKMSEPYFEFEYDTKTRDLTVGEDLGFCKKVNALGYKFFVDFGMVCSHFKQVNLLDVNNYAVSYATKSVNAYHAEIKPKVEALSNELRRIKMSPSAPSKPKSNLILPEYLK